MVPFIQHTGKVALLDRVNVDTDQMVPKQFCKLLTREGYGRILFYGWRYLPGEVPNPDFVLNQPRYQNASVLLARKNFGCGSSREHAAWAVLDFGFRAILAPSYADIFYTNCFKNGILPIVLAERQIDELFDKAKQITGYSLVIDLPSQTVRDEFGLDLSFDLDHFRKKCLLNGLDEIGLTLEHESEISRYESRAVPVIGCHHAVDAKFGRFS